MWRLSVARPSNPLWAMAMWNTCPRLSQRPISLWPIRGTTASSTYSPVRQTIVRCVWTLQTFSWVSPRRWKSLIRMAKCWTPTQASTSVLRLQWAVGSPCCYSFVAIPHRAWASAPRSALSPPSSLRTNVWCPTRVSERRHLRAYNCFIDWRPAEGHWVLGGCCINSMSRHALKWNWAML